MTPGRPMAAGQAALETLDARLRTLLPPEYQDSYEDLQPVPMRAAGMQYDAAGRVAWDQIWGSFCDLAMAGGPPHKGALLAHGTQDEIDAHFDRYDDVAEEICRGIRMVTGLRAYVSPTPGWVCVICLGDGMAGWLMRAIVMENVEARRRGAVLELPAAPHFRLDKEIKNVVTVIAKTCHYWLGHVPSPQQREVAAMLEAMNADAPLLEPDSTGESDGRREAVAAAAAVRIELETGLRRAAVNCPGWLGLQCPDVRSAVWMMRALVAGNVLSRREATVLLVPVNPASDPDGTRMAGAVAQVYGYARARGAVKS